MSEYPNNVRVFFVTPTKLHEQKLRRICSKGGCGWYMTSTFIGRVEGEQFTSGEIGWDRADPRWPAKCEKCGDPFKPTDHWLVDYECLHSRSDNGELVTLRDAPPGACWNVSWYSEATRSRVRPFLCLTGRMPKASMAVSDSFRIDPDYAATLIVDNLRAAECSPELARDILKRCEDKIANGELRKRPPQLDS